MPGKVVLQALDIRKRLGSTEVLQGVTLSLRESETIVVVGPSGCGKTTLLNIVSGLAVPDAGEVRLATDSADSHAIGYMMQESLLLPWRTLGGNAMLGVEVVGDRGDSGPRCSRLFAELGLDGCYDLLPRQTSGGMARRVALIRTLLCRPRLLLLDEPFSSLDFDIKLRTQQCLMACQRADGFSVILVTHDIEDAIALADRVVILSNKPTSVKAEIPTGLGCTEKDPIEARKSPRFREYFIKIWDELKYLEPEAG